MGDWAVGGTSKWVSHVVNAVNTSSSAHTKGSWVQVTAGTAYPANGLYISRRYCYPDVDYLVDIGFGGAGSEQVIISNLMISAGTINVQSGVGQIYVPITVPLNTRIAARSQGTDAAAREVQLTIAYGVGGSAAAKAYSYVDTYGANTGDSGGTSVDPGGTAYADGSYVQMTAATTRPGRGVFLAFGNAGNTLRTDYQWSFTIGVGGAGSEDTKVYYIPVGCPGGGRASPTPFSSFYPLDIPMGARVAVKCWCSGNDATDRLLDVVLYVVG